jgi:hypothetical protein
VGAPPNKLCGGWFAHAMIFDMSLGRFPRVVHCVFVVAASKVGVMSCCFVFSGFVVFRGLLMVSCCVFVVFSCLVMMLCCLLRHVSSHRILLTINRVIFA